MINASLLMSIYDKVSPIALSQCLNSLAKQSRMPNQIVMIKDGPLNPALEETLDKFEADFPQITLIVPIETNQGLINALNTGLQYCSGDWIVRMDADDVAKPDRLEKQLGYLEEHADIDVLGSAMLEFEDNPDKPSRLKPVLINHKEILKSIALRNPINHPTVCIRKVLLQQVGGYPQLELLEDYLLWVNLLKAGAKFHNLGEALIHFRFDRGTLKRRRGFDNFKNECRLRWWIYQQKLSNPLQLVLGISIQVILRFSPLSLQEFLWHASRQRISD